MNIAVFLPNWIGDAVMATPAIRALREHFAGAQLTGVLKPYVGGVLEGTPWFDRLIYVDKSKGLAQGMFAAVRALRRNRPDLAVLFPNSYRSAITAWLGGSRKRFGYRRFARTVLLTNTLEPKRDAYLKITPSPVIDAYNLLATAAGCPDPGYRMELATTEDDECRANDVFDAIDLDQSRELVCLNPGAAFGAAKHWPMEYFAALAKDLVDQRGSSVLVLCGPNERDQAKRIVAAADRPQVVTVADHALSIGLTKACIRRCDLLVSTDSGPRHFAAAFDRPVVSLFGPTFVEWTITYHPKEVCLQKKVPCGPCQQRVCPLDHRCMRELLPKDVMNAVDQLLTKHPPQRPMQPDQTPYRKAS